MRAVVPFMSVPVVFVILCGINMMTWARPREHIYEQRNMLFSLALVSFLLRMFFVLLSHAFDSVARWMVAMRRTHVTTPFKPMICAPCTMHNKTFTMTNSPASNQTMFLFCFFLVAVYVVVLYISTLFQYSNVWKKRRNSLYFSCNVPTPYWVWVCVRACVRVRNKCRY